MAVSNDVDMKESTETPVATTEIVVASPPRSTLQRKSIPLSLCLCMPIHSSEEWITEISPSRAILRAQERGFVCGARGFVEGDAPDRSLSAHADVA